MRSLLVGLCLLALPQACRAEASGGCNDLQPPAAAPSSPKRALTPADLARIRDIGPVESPGMEAHYFTRSPDGSRVAFQLRRADPARNDYCLGMFVLSLQPGAKPVPVDRGGEFIRIHFDLREAADTPMGVARTITPRWSADGRWIAFLKRVDGKTQIWRAEADGTGSRPLSTSAVDVEDFRLSGDGRALLYTSRPALVADYQAIAEEGLRGHHFDDRFVPATRSTPFPHAPVPRIVTAQDLATGETRRATDAEAASFPSAPIWEAAWTEMRGPGGRRAHVTVPDGASYVTRGRLAAEDAQGHDVVCAAAICANAFRPWWTPTGHVRFQHREGWANGSTAIYDWVPSPSAPRRIYLTDEVLADCMPDDTALLCLREGSLTPRRLERLDPDTGRRSVLFDPNPEFQSLTLGPAERLHLTNSFGLPVIADLILPVGYRKEVRYPLIVVQYDTRGFLRGGTGDAFPIQVYANAGYAVLSVSRPDLTPGKDKRTDVKEAERANLAAFANRKSELSALEVAAQLAIDRGVADPKRIGLTGMSDGATVSDWAILHSTMFAAFATTNCCFDETFLSRIGPAAARLFVDIGYPRLSDRSKDADAFWDEISLVRNATKITRPILVQVADEEMLSALPTFTALREVNAPIDMFVLPGEHHYKWQPAHRLAMYERSLDWFDFWLKGEVPNDPTRRADVRRWEALAKERGATPGPAPR